MRPRSLPAMISIESADIIGLGIMLSASVWRAPAPLKSMRLYGMGSSDCKKLVHFICCSCGDKEARGTMGGPRQLTSKESEMGVVGGILSGVPRSWLMGKGDRMARVEASDGVEAADERPEAEARPSDNEWTMGL